MIGLLDYDLLQSKKTSVLIPNLEIMKLATYYRVEENHFCRLLTLDDTELTSYDKIYFFSETAKSPQIPEAYLRANNVEFGGAAFTKKYIPFKNEIIDYTIPRSAIYKEFLKQKYNDGVKAKTIAHVIDDSYYRMYAGKNRLPIPPILPRKRIYLYDKDFFYDDWEEILTQISERNPCNIVRIHPVVCKTLTQYFKVRSFSKFSRANPVILDINIPLDDVNYMLNHYKNLFLADITKTSNVFLSLGGTLPTQAKYFRDFIYKLNLLYSFWSCGILIKIKFEEPDIGVKNPLQNISLLAETICDVSKERHRDVTLNERITKRKKDTILADERDLLLKFYPSAEELFNHSFNDIQQRGRWRI